MDRPTSLRDPDRTRLTIRLPQKLYEKLQREAKKRDMELHDLIRAILEDTS